MRCMMIEISYLGIRYCSQIVLDTLLHSYDKLYLELLIGKTLKEGFHGTGYIEINAESKEKLKEFIGKFENREFKTNVLTDSWREICKGLSGSFSSELEACLYFTRAMLVTEEVKQTPLEYKNSLYRTGIPACNFFLDLLNLIGGYHILNDKQREDYPHLLLVLGMIYTENLQTLLENPTAEDRPYNFIDNLCLRLYV